MSLRSSGSMTLRRASRIWSWVGIAQPSDGTPKKANAAPRRAPPAEGGEILHCRRDMMADSLTPCPGLSGRAGGSAVA